MLSEPYVALSAQISLEKRLQSVAVNVANMKTIGYRATGITFHTIESETGKTPVAYSVPGTNYIVRAQGPLIKTDNPLDVAVNGEGWLAIQTPAGKAYTRDGRMQMQPNGSLQTLNGYPVLDTGGAPIQLDPAGGRVVIGKDGMISQRGNQIGALGLFMIPAQTQFTRFDNSAVIPQKPATPVLDFDTNGVVQGHLEGSNINPVLEMAKLMTISRAVDSVSAASSNTQTSLKDAVKTLGDPVP
ncbi:Flagellar basal-body rod protein FlgF [Methylovirgula sp. HY1]|nr:flagellar basal-body rod protein FlgF [Methylovirgula sp. HY1]QXX74727.1 Flagellar basal-body rod protein FlgF [Methylovirgula sp. HY1]